MVEPTEIEIEIAYAEPQKQWLEKIKVPINSTIQSVLRLAVASFDFLPTAQNMAFGIFGNLKSEQTILQSGDRLEIYRSLKIDPRDRRWEIVNGVRSKSIQKNE